MRRLALVLSVLLSALPAQAQADVPSGEAVVDAWQRGWRDAAAGVEAVEMDETSVRTVTGPRGTVRVEAEGRLRYAPGVRAERTVERATVNGAPVDPARLPALDGRHARAFGRSGGPVSRPPPSPDGLLSRATARRVRAEALDGAAAWRVDLVLGHAPSRHGRPHGRSRPPGRRADGSPPRATAWFSAAEAPRLLRLHLPGPPDGGDGLTVDFVRVDGLDLPAASRAAATVRQRRRLRDYAVTAIHEAQYRQHRIVRQAP